MTYLCQYEDLESRARTTSLNMDINTLQDRQPMLHLTFDAFGS